MTPQRRVVLYLAGVALAAVLAACGGSDGPTSTPTPTPVPTPPPPRVVSEGAGFALPSDYIAGVYFDITATGTIEATVDYTYADSLLVVWIAKGQCTAETFEAEQCPFVATSFAGSKPRKVTASGQAAGAYTLIVGNGGPRDESLSFQVVFTQATAGGSVGASARRAAKPAFLVPLPAHARPR